MSQVLRDVEGRETGPLGFNGPVWDEVMLGGGVTVPLAEFCQLAGHVLRGGMFGWPHGDEPACVREVCEAITQQTLRRRGL